DRGQPRYRSRAPPAPERPQREAPRTKSARGRANPSDVHRLRRPRVPPCGLGYVPTERSWLLPAFHPYQRPPLPPHKGRSGPRSRQRPEPRTTVVLDQKLMPMLPRRGIVRGGAVARSVVRLLRAAALPVASDADRVALVRGADLLRRAQRDRELTGFCLLAQHLDAEPAAPAGARRVLVGLLIRVGVVRRVGRGRDAVRLRHAATVALAPDTEGLVAVLRVLLLGGRQCQRALLRLGLLAERLNAATRQILICMLAGVGVVRGVGVGRDVVGLVHAAVVALAPDAHGGIAVLGVLLLCLGRCPCELFCGAGLPCRLDSESVLAPALVATGQLLVDPLRAVAVTGVLGRVRDVVRLRHVATVALAPDADGLVPVLCSFLLGRRGRKRALLGRALLAGDLEGQAVGAVATTRRAALVLVDGLR